MMERVVGEDTARGAGGYWPKLDVLSESDAE
jgi:hypothetical protein